MPHGVPHHGTQYDTVSTCAPIIWYVPYAIYIYTINALWAINNRYPKAVASLGKTVEDDLGAMLLLVLFESGPVVVPLSTCSSGAVQHEFYFLRGAMSL